MRAELHGLQNGGGGEGGVSSLFLCTGNDVKSSIRAEFHGSQNGGGGEDRFSPLCDGEEGGGKSGDGFEEGVAESGDASLPDSRFCFAMGDDRAAALRPA